MTWLPDGASPGMVDVAHASLPVVESTTSTEIERRSTLNNDEAVTYTGGRCGVWACAEWVSRDANDRPDIGTGRCQGNAGKRHRSRCSRLPQILRTPSGLFSVAIEA